jgi:Cu+-exporting ATPase
MDHDNGAHAHDHAGPAPVDGSGRRATDPVCGMKVDPALTSHHAEHGGETYHFCSEGCRSKFVAAPERYLRHDLAPDASTAPAAEGTIYTCPMHPQIQQPRPGNCPICGMSLEPLVATSGPVENAELADMTRRFWIGLVLTVPVFALEMGGHLTGLTERLGQQNANWAQLVLATPVVLWAGKPMPQVPERRPDA